MDDNQSESALSSQADVTEPKQTEDGWIIRRPKRKKVTEEEALKWTESFAAERKEQLIAALRKSKG